MPTTEVRPLPTTVDLKAIENALQAAFDVVDKVEDALRDVSEIGVASNYPVTFESVGIVAEIRTILDFYVKTFQKSLSMIDSTMFDVITARDEQEQFGFPRRDSADAS